MEFGLNLKNSTISIGLFILIAGMASIPIIILQMASAQSAGNNSTHSTLVNNTQNNNIPIVADNDRSFMVWATKINGNSEIMFTSHTNDGAGFSKKINLSNSPNSESINPSIVVNGSFVYITWWELYPNGAQLPAYIQSANNGTSFGSVTILSSLSSQ
jgi:hypothetical protein